MIKRTIAVNWRNFYGKLQKYINLKAIWKQPNEPTYNQRRNKQKQTSRQAPGSADGGHFHLFVSIFLLINLLIFFIHSFVGKLWWALVTSEGGFFFVCLFDCAVCRENAVINFEQLDVMSEFTDGVSSVSASRHAGIYSFGCFCSFHFSPSVFCCWFLLLTAIGFVRLLWWLPLT